MNENANIIDFIDDHTYRNSNIAFTHDGMGNIIFYMYEDAITVGIYMMSLNEENPNPVQLSSDTANIRNIVLLDF